MPKALPFEKKRAKHCSVEKRKRQSPFAAPALGYSQE
jgi:hypothetical protein